MARLPYNQFTGPYRMRMGIQPLPDPDHWIVIDESEYAVELAEKRRLMAEQGDAVFRALPGSEDACAEALEMLVAHLIRSYPDHYALKDGCILVRATGETWRLDPPAVHPLELAGRLVQEDFLVLQPDANDDYCLTAATLCFPSFWRLAEKIGRPLQAIHAPVPELEQAIGGAMARFFRALPVGRPSWRQGGASIAAAREMFQPASKGERNRKLIEVGEINPDNAHERLFLRFERQTMIRMPRSGAVLFVVHLYRYALGDLMDEPDVAQGLATFLRTLSPGMAAYKAVDIMGPPALAVLDRIVARAAQDADRKVVQPVPI